MCAPEALKSGIGSIPRVDLSFLGSVEAFGQVKQ